MSEVKAELQSVLASKEFRQSKALSKLLRYICSKALIGDSDPITEYTIAVDVLGKQQDFKESKDANVRVEVHRLRKRLAEFYDREGASHAIRIVIPTGHYVPQFLAQNGYTALAEAPIELSLPTAPELDAEILPQVEDEPVVAVEQVPMPLLTLPAPPRRPAWRRLKVAAVVVVVGLVAVIFAVRALMRPGDSLDNFWRPVISAPGPILICVGNVQGGHHEGPGGAIADPNHVTMSEFHRMSSQLVHFDDSITLSRFAGFLQAKGKPYRVVSQSEATFSDFQNGSAVLIGLFNNEWTGRLVDKLRFRMEQRYPSTLILRDLQHPERDDWAIDYTAPYLGLTKDYALVLRVLDPKTEQMVVSAAGISVFGTLAAGEFLTNPDEFRKIEAVAPKGWQKMNFEMVLSTDVIRGKSGRPHIVAWRFW